MTMRDTPDDFDDLDDDLDSPPEDTPPLEAQGPVVNPLEDDTPLGEVDIKVLLEAGVHFGHQTKKWNPKMGRFIFGKRNDVHILDLQKTLRGLKRARNFLAGAVRDGKKVLFVSTKRQAQEIVQREAKKAGAYWVTERWLGGMLTNFDTIQKRVKHLKSIEKMQEEGELDRRVKKEAAKLRKQLARLDKYLGGIKEMRGLPDVVFVIDPKREHIAIKEARKLSIPIVGLVDTNCDPDEIDYVIPGNDDAIRSIKVVSQYLAQGMAEALAERQQKAAKGDQDDEAGTEEAAAEESATPPAETAAEAPAEEAAPAGA